MLITIQWFIIVCFWPWFLLSLLGFPWPFTFKLKEILAKREFNLGSPRFEPITMPMPIQYTIIQPIHVSR